jgi:hypothetical protein
MIRNHEHRSAGILKAVYARSLRRAVDSSQSVEATQTGNWEPGPHARFDGMQNSFFSTLEVLDVRQHHVAFL